MGILQTIQDEYNTEQENARKEQSKEEFRHRIRLEREATAFLRDLLHDEFDSSKLQVSTWTALYDIVDGTDVLQLRIERWATISKTIGCAAYMFNGEMIPFDGHYDWRIIKTRTDIGRIYSRLKREKKELADALKIAEENEKMKIRLLTPKPYETESFWPYLKRCFGITD